MHLNLIILFALLVCLPFSSFSQENCANGIDDDGDGLIDLNDPDCFCNGNNSLPLSIIPNPSFENITCCPNGYSQLNCADTWVQASIPSTDLLNTCFFTAYCNQAGLIPFPDGNGAAGIIGKVNYKEYLGACLINPMQVGTSYILKFTVGLMGTIADSISYNVDTCQLTSLPPIVFLDLFGQVNCGNFPYSSSDCPISAVSGYSVIGSASINTTISGYQTVTMLINPTFNVNEIVLGFQCNLPSGWPQGIWNVCTPYLVVDNLILNTENSFGGVSITSKGSICGNDLVLKCHSNSNGIFQWYKAGVAILGQNNSTLNVSALGLGPGNFGVRFDDGSNCYVENIDLDGQSLTQILSNNAEICYGDSAVLSASGGVSYTWTPNNNLNQNNGSSVIVSPESTTTYIVTGTDINGCIDTSISVVTVLPTPTDVVVNISPLKVKTDALITLSPSNYSYTWTSPDSSINYGYSHYYTFVDDGFYEFIVEVENSFGCTTEFMIPITIDSDILVFVPNAFTPDGNEYNETFQPIMTDKLDPSTYRFTILNRWGEIIFQSNDIKIGWDGRINNEKAESGIYSWTIELKLKNSDKKKQYYGHVSIIK